MLPDLIKIADALDENGLYNEAAYVDLLIKNSADYSRSVQAFVNDLKKALKDVSNSSVSSHINKEAVSVVFNIIDAILSRQSYIGPDIAPEAISQLEDPEVVLAQSIVALEEDIEKIKSIIVAETDLPKADHLKRELDKLQDHLKELYGRVDNMRTGKLQEDPVRFKAFVKHLDNLRRKRIVEQYKPGA
jgi:hypothetical protein